MRARLTGRLAAVAALVVFTAGCAAHWAYRQGQDASDKGDWDLAVARYTRALEKDPQNIRYKISLENARIQASEGWQEKRASSQPWTTSSWETPRAAFTRPTWL